MKRLLGILGLGLAVWCDPGWAAAPTALKEGDSLPPVALRDQDGAAFRFDSQKGRAVILTFVFSRCSVPSFCPAMSANFRALQKAIREDGSLANRVHLVSVSIDPAFDTPEVLKRYADHFAIDTSDWSFVTGEERSVAGLAAAFSVFVDPTPDGSIDHTLTTALAGPDGKIRKLWRGNRWTPEEAVKELRATFAPAMHPTDS
jgi:protein SCO1/2